jgi:hypothetical protein
LYITIYIGYDEEMKNPDLIRIEAEKYREIYKLSTVIVNNCKKELFVYAVVII